MIGESGSTVTVLSDAFFTHLACGQPQDGLSDIKIPNVSQELDKYISTLSRWKRWEYKYMKTKALSLIWLEKEIFRRIATSAIPK
jgi:hypothetical protein